MDNDLSIIENMVNNIETLRKTIPKNVKLSMVLKQYHTSSISYVDMGIIIDKRTDAIDTFCIVNILDGIIMRTQGIVKPIVLLYWHPADKALLMHQYSIEPSVVNLEWIEIASKVLKNVSSPLKVHLWIDVGMGREGVKSDEAIVLARAIKACPYLKLSGVATHFPIKMLSKNNKWIQRTNYSKMHKIFKDTLNMLRYEKLIDEDVIIHAATSNAINSNQTQLYYNMVRIGTLIYYGDKPYYSFKQKILQIKDISEFIGYDMYIGHISHVALIEIPGNRDKVKKFMYNDYELKEIMPGVLDITNIQCSVGDDIIVSFTN